MLPAITVESLKEDKGYAKAAKKYTKEHESLQKKHNKERISIASNQCKAIEKLANKSKSKYSSSSFYTVAHRLDCSRL